MRASGRVARWFFNSWIFHVTQLVCINIVVYVRELCCSRQHGGVNLLGIAPSVCQLTFTMLTIVANAFNRLILESIPTNVPRGCCKLYIGLVSIQLFQCQIWKRLLLRDFIAILFHSSIPVNAQVSRRFEYLTSRLDQKNPAIILSIQ